MLVGGVDYTECAARSGLVKYARTGGDPYKSVVSESEEPRCLPGTELGSGGPPGWPAPHRLCRCAFSEARGLGVLQFHGVGGDYLDVSARAHRSSLEYLRPTPGDLGRHVPGRHGLRVGANR